MKKLHGISFDVVPLDSDGFLLRATIQMDNKKQPDGAHSLFEQLQQQTKKTETKMVYCPDSQHVGMVIQEMIDNATIEANKIEE